MKKIAAFLALMTTSSALHAACTVTPSLWDWPRSGEAILSVKAIQPCINAYLANPKSSLLIHHGQDTDSMLHADELRAWLVSLAINPAKIRDAADPTPGLAIENVDH